MPIYEYVCKNCSKEFELIQKISDPPAKKCPDCGKKIEKKLSLSSFQLKGTGWYATDFAGKGKEQKSEKKESKTDSKTESSKDSAPKTENKSKASSSTSKE
jgi:putative FmdB family regulatory protein